jgi:putative heme iron utilization protein
MSVEPLERARAARELFRAARSGVLSSHSVKVPGFPYGSALPHVTDHHGRPVILISHLAEHTHNVEADRRVSFLVSPSGEELQSGARATLVGDASPLAEPAAIEGRYLRLFPDHQRYLEIGGFRFWVIEPLQVRYIAGFGSLHWIAGSSFIVEPGEMPELEASALEHMNRDHADALRGYCRQHALDPAQVEMVGLDCDGFDLRADGHLLRCAFPEPVQTAAHARAALAELARDSRR